MVGSNVALTRYFTTSGVKNPRHRLRSGLEIKI